MQKNGPPNVPKKSSNFNRNYRLILLLYFKKDRNFIQSGGCSKSTKLISHTTKNVWTVMQKNGPPNAPKKQVRISIGIIDLFAYSILKNIEILSNQGVVQSQPNSYPRLPVMFGL